MHAQALIRNQTRTSSGGVGGASNPRERSHRVLLVRASTQRACRRAAAAGAHRWRGRSSARRKAGLRPTKPRALLAALPGLCNKRAAQA